MMLIGTTALSHDPIYLQAEREITAGMRVRRWYYDNVPSFRNLVALSNSRDIVPAVVSVLKSPQGWLWKRELRKVVHNANTKQITAIFKNIADGREQAPHAVECALAIFTPEQILVEQKQKGEWNFAGHIMHKQYLGKNLEKKPLSYSNSNGWVGTFLYSLNFFAPDTLPAGKWEASQYIDVNSRFIVIPLVLFTALCAVCAPWIATVATVGVVALFVIGLWIYKKKSEQCPDELFHCRNLTKEALENCSARIVGRDQDVERMARALGQSSFQKSQHPVLVGDSGVGKSTTLEAFARSDFVKNKKMFLLDVKALCDAQRTGMNDAVIALFFKTLRKYPEIILCIDEMQLCFTGEDKGFGDTLKRELDKLPYFIGITTGKEFNEVIAAEPTRVRRFKPLHIPTMNRESTILVLLEKLREWGGDIEFDYSEELPEGETSVTTAVLGYIYDRSSGKDQQQPNAALTLLAKVVSHIEWSDTHTEHDDKQKMEFLAVRCEEGLKNKKNVEALQKEMKELQEKILEQENEEKRQSENQIKIDHMRQEREEQEKQLFLLAKKYEQVNDEVEKQKIAARYLYIEQHLLPYLCKELKDLYKDSPSNKLTIAKVKEVLEKSEEPGDEEFLVCYDF
jgi:hypothetical protein